MKPPSYSAVIWVSDPYIYIELNDTMGGNRKHQVKFPNDTLGMAQALKLVNARNATSKLCSAGDLTQHQIDHALKAKIDDFLKTRKPKTSATEEQRASATDILREMGLI